MTKIVTVYNQKGGCGKTTLAVNVAHGLATLGHSVTLVDLANPPYLHRWLDLAADNTAVRWLMGENVPRWKTRIGVDVLTGHLPSVMELLDGGVPNLTKEMIVADRFWELGTDWVIVDGYRNEERDVEQTLLQVSDIVLVPHTAETPIESTRDTLKWCREIAARRVCLVGIIGTLRDMDVIAELGQFADSVLLLTSHERMRKRRTAFETPRVVKAMVEIHNLCAWLEK